MNRKLFSYPERIRLANLPTPFHRLNRIGGSFGTEMWVKRDDMTGMALSGNKIRKLEFTLAEALSRKADVLLTCGGAQSNHARATAVAAAQLGLKSRLILRTPDPENPPAPTGNILLDRMAGAEIVWITPEKYRNREVIFDREAELLEKTGHRPYRIPEGASDEIGAWGYIRAVEELSEDLASNGLTEGPPVTILAATGSGGTVSGIAMGVKLLGLNAKVVCINVCDDAEYFRRIITGICDTCIEKFQLDIRFNVNRDLEIIDGYAGRGYALSRPEELSLICDVARTEGLFLDPVYTGKAFFGMVSELEKDAKRFGERLVFIHTGGLFGLFPAAGDVAEVM